MHEEILKNNLVGSNKKKNPSTRSGSFPVQSGRRVSSYRQIPNGSGPDVPSRCARWVQSVRSLSAASSGSARNQSPQHSFPDLY
jgi:hypothetical protein